MVGINRVRAVFIGGLIAQPVYWFMGIEPVIIFMGTLSALFYWGMLEVCNKLDGADKNGRKKEDIVA